jgi:hypothetical protein
LPELGRNARGVLKGADLLRIESGLKGEVQVFSVEHPKATRVYAWSHETEGGKRRFHAVMGLFPVDNAAMAVRAAVLDETPGSS